MKNKLREDMRKKRENLSVEEVMRKSKSIERNLFDLDEYKKAKTVMFYVSTGKEVFTHSMIAEALKEKKVAVPVTDKKNNDLIPSFIKSFNELEEGTFHILEPKSVDKADPKEIDIVILPGLVFDIKGNRIGYGKGYYDVFLPKTNALKIALAYEFKVKEQIPNDKKDVKVDMIVTEKGVVYCS